MSVTSQITDLENNVKSAYSAIRNKGGTIPANKNLSNLSAAIAAIPTEGGVSINNQDLTITENGEYEADLDHTGLGLVTVNVDNSLEELQAQLNIERALAGGIEEDAEDTRDEISDNIDEFLYGNHGTEKITYDITFNLSNTTDYDIVVKDTVSTLAWAVNPDDSRMLNLDANTSVSLVFYGVKFSEYDTPTVVVDSVSPNTYTCTASYDEDLGYITSCSFTVTQDVTFNLSRTDAVTEPES